MKKLIKKSTAFLLLLAFALVFNACQKSEGSLSDAPEKTVAQEMKSSEETGSFSDLPNDLIGYEEEITNHVEGHGLNLDNIEKFNQIFPDGTSEDKFLVDGCIAMSRAELDNIKNLIENGQKQYRTNNLVSPQTITVVGLNTGTYALTSQMRTALSWAINNYNALPLNLTFSLSFSGNYSNADIVVYRNPYNSGAGGVAGFPSGGQPYRWVQIYAGMSNYSTNVNEHVMTHEIGHCLGLRHTDYFSRASCGQNSNEGSAGVGAVHVPGTPTGIDWNSVMLACFSSNEDGEFGYYDRVALQYLY